MQKLKAFTLAEILITMGIVGVIAALTVPDLVSDYQNKAMAVKARKSFNEIEEALDLMLTDEGKNTLRTSSLYTRDDGVAYFATHYLKTISSANGFSTDKYYPLEERKAQEAKGDDEPAISATKPENFSCDGSTYVLADSTAICLSLNSSITGGLKITMDTNGKEPPNTGGRDMFSFIINNNATIIKSKEQSENCHYQPFGGGCIPRLMENNWKMDY